VQGSAEQKRFVMMPKVTYEEVQVPYKVLHNPPTPAELYMKPIRTTPCHGATLSNSTSPLALTRQIQICGLNCPRWLVTYLFHWQVLIRNGVEEIVEPPQLPTGAVEVSASSHGGPSNGEFPSFVSRLEVPAQKGFSEAQAAQPFLRPNTFAPTP
jgi:hypothetical protein